MTDTNLPNPFIDFNSAPSPSDADTTVASICSAPVPDAAVGYYSNSDDVDDWSLPSGEIEPSVMVAYTPSESIALNALEQAWLAGNNASIEDCDSESSGNPACGHLAAPVDDPAVAAFSIPESAVTPPAPQVTSAGVTGANGAGSHGVSSPVDDLHRFDAHFDPEMFMAELDPPPIFLNSNQGAK